MGDDLKMEKRGESMCEREEMIRDRPQIWVNNTFI